MLSREEKTNQSKTPTQKLAREHLGTFLGCWLVLFEVYMLHQCLGAWSQLECQILSFFLSNNMRDLLQRQKHRKKIIAALILWTKMFIRNFATICKEN